MTGSIERRLSALERAEWERLHALPPREWLTRGYIRIERLPPPERAEMEALFSRVFDDAGQLRPERLTDAERRRASDLVAMWIADVERNPYP